MALCSVLGAVYLVLYVSWLAHATRGWSAGTARESGACALNPLILNAARPRKSQYRVGHVPAPGRFFERLGVTDGDLRILQLFTRRKPY